MTAAVVCQKNARRRASQNPGVHIRRKKHKIRRFRKPEKPDKPEKPEKPSKPEKPKNPQEVPKTGDAANAAGYLLLLAGAAAGLVFSTGMLRKRRKTNR